MAGKRVDKMGRYIAQAERNGDATEGDPKRAGEADRSRAGKKAPRPAFCRVYARARVAEAMPALIRRLLEEAEKGSLPHLKVLVQLSGLDTGEVVPQSGRRKGKSLERVLKERWEQDRLEAEADRAEERARQGGRGTNGDGRLDEG